jgi:hypothetical protein
MAKRGQTDWTRVKHEYVTGAPAPTYTALALKYGLRRETVTRKGERGNWPMERERFVQRVTEQRETIKATTLAGEGAEFDKTCFTLAKWLVTEAVKDRQAGSSLRETAGVINTAQSIAKTALGDRPTIQQELQIEGATSIDDLLEQYRDALSEGSASTGDHPTESLHTAQEPQPERDTVPQPH